MQEGPSHHIRQSWTNSLFWLHLRNVNTLSWMPVLPPHTYSRGLHLDHVHTLLVVGKLNLGPINALGLVLLSTGEGSTGVGRQVWTEPRRLGHGQ